MNTQKLNYTLNKLRNNTFYLLTVLLTVSCSAPDKPEEPQLTKAEILEQEKEETDSLMIVYDSIMELRIEIPQLVDSTIVSPDCLRQFNFLARETNGGVKVVANSRFVAKEIASIVDNNVIDNTDLMIIVDKTSSMEDDLDNIKKGLNQILNSLREKENIRLSVSTYGDKNFDGDLWYDFQNFESDFDRTMEFIESIQMTHGGDFPESVYDGIHEAFQEEFWKSDSKRLVILLGDAPSLDSTYSEYSENDIVEIATKDKINMNFYPIVLSPYDGQFGDIKKMQNLSFIETVYPNPTKGPLTIKLNQFGDFTLEIFNPNGKLINSETISTGTYKTDLYDQPSGLYTVRVSDENKNYDTRKIILNK